MAGDWIKMRIDLQSHPKVVRILSATKSDKFRVVGGLHAVWGVFDTHSIDGVLHGYTPETMNHVVGFDGIAEAMIAVGWLLFDDDETLVMPEFDEHNGKSGKRRAEDQKRKKESRKSPQNVRSLSANEQDKKQTREEKRRDISTSLRSVDTLPRPESVSSENWDAFIEVRKGLKAKNTLPAINALINQLGKLQAEGHEPNAVVEQSIRSSWKDLYPIKQQSRASPSPPHRMSAVERQEEMARKMFGGAKNGSGRIIDIPQD